jgi:mannose-6-phosphate isomerase
MLRPVQPIRFQPIFRSYLWGGQRLASRLGKKLPDDGIWAESWEIVDHREGESTVDSGPLTGWTLRKLIETFPKEILGQNTPHERFPLLFKYLDCQRVLSVQVHPNDAYGLQMPQPDRGKTEAWYVIEAEGDAVLYAGLKPGVGRPDLQAAIHQGRTEECLHVLRPQAGDCVFIPAGTVHALGAGLVVAEIQQASDCTFRLFDWNRVDKDGQPRPLHIQQALEVIDFESGPVSFVTRKSTPTPDESILVDCDKFRLMESRSTIPTQLPLNQFCIVTIPKGSGVIRSEQDDLTLEQGQSVLIPHACEQATLQLAQGSVALIATPPLPA